MNTNAHSSLRFPAEPSQSPAELLHSWLEVNRISQKEFAAESGLSEALVSMLLNKKRRFSSGILSLIATATGTSESEWIEHVQIHEKWSTDADIVTNKGAIAPGILSNLDISNALRTGLVRIDPSEGVKTMQCSIDLTLGYSKKLPSPAWLQTDASFDAGDSEAKKERHLKIAPGESWLAWARQQVWLSPGFCGRLGGISDLTISGILVNAGTQINPGWKGYPFATLHNPTGEVFELDLNQPFLTLELQSLSSPADLSHLEKHEAE